MKRAIKLTKKSLNELAMTMKTILFSFLILWSGLLYSQTNIDYYNHFTPERQQVLSMMGEFFDETIRKNFPATVDTLSYKKFYDCFYQNESLGHIILIVDRDKLREINQLLFKDHNYFFFYSRYIHIREDTPPVYTDIESDIVPTVRGFAPGINMAKYGTMPFLNRNGYIKVANEDNIAVKIAKEDIEISGDLTVTLIFENLMQANLREISQPVVKELLAVVFWRWICICGGVNLVERKPYCEPCVSVINNP